MKFFDQKRRKQNHRPHISMTEKWIGWLILLLLAGIAIGVYLKGQRYDSRIFALDTSLLERTSEIAPTVASGATDETSATGRVAGILPPPVPGWKLMGPVEQFNPEDLYVKINGRAEQYLAYDFVGLETATLISEQTPDLFIDIFIYDMGTNTNAFGIYSVERSPGEKMEIGDEGYFTAGSLFFRKGRYYNQIITVVETPELRAIVEQIAAWIDQAQTTSTTGMSVFDSFPEQYRVPDSMQYLKVDALGLSFLTDVYTVTYERDGIEIVSFLTKRPSEAEAKQIFNQYVDYIGKYGVTLPAREVDGIPFITGDLGGFYDVVFRKGSYVGGVNFVEDRELAEETAQLLGNNLPQ